MPWDREALESGDPMRQAEYLKKLVKTLETLLQQIVVISNYSIDVVDGAAIYSKLKNADGSYPLGTWRLIQVGDDWQRQVQLTANTWTLAGAFERPL